MRRHRRSITADAVRRHVGSCEAESVENDGNFPKTLNLERSDRCVQGKKMTMRTCAVKMAG